MAAPAANATTNAWWAWNGRGGKSVLLFRLMGAVIAILFAALVIEARKGGNNR